LTYFTNALTVDHEHILKRLDMHKNESKEDYQEAQEEVNSIQQNIHLMKFELTASAFG
jgi:hypothetical protein